MYYSFENDEKKTVVTTVRLTLEEKQLIDDFKRDNPGWDFTNYVRKCIKQHFFSRRFIKKEIADLKRVCKNLEERLRYLDSKDQKQTNNYSKQEIDEFLTNLSSKEHRVLLQTVKILDNDIHKIQGRYNFYRNEIDPTITKDDFAARLNMFKHLMEVKHARIEQRTRQGLLRRHAEHKEGHGESDQQDQHASIGDSREA